MTASYTYILETGTVSADTADLLSDVQAEWVAAFDSSINTDSSTAQGKMMTGETTARASVMKNNAEVTNMLNPQLAYGTHLDAICALMAVERTTNQSTVVSNVLITGNSQTPIPAGSRIETQSGDIFASTADITIPASGQIYATFQSQSYGAFAFPAESCTILDGVIGWGTAAGDSTTSVISGTTQNTDPQLKNKRNRQLAKQGQGTAAALEAALLDVANVTDVNVVENNTGSAGTVNGITFTKTRGLWVCVAGTATDADIAAAMYAAHNGGCPWDYGAAGMGNPVNSPNGVSTTDPTTGLPYNVLWTTPIEYDVYVNATVKQTAAQSPGTTNIQTAMTNFANGLIDGEDGFVMGASVTAFDLSGAVTAAYPGVSVRSCMVALVPAGSAAPVYPTDYIYEKDLLPYEQASLKSGNITVTLQ